ncbi:MAG TPA: Uma2 family endonuclease [Phycisphaerae bacterium]
MLTERQYLRCIDAPGYVAEIFDGVVHMSPMPVPTHNFWQGLTYELLLDLTRREPNIINKIAHDNEIVIAGRPGVTRPRPDVSAYRNFPRLEALAKNDDWSLYCPIVLVEVISKRRRRKDIERNRVPYWAAGGIAEYWIIDPSKDPRRPAMIVLTREAGRPTWVERKVAFGETYRSAALGGLEVNLRALAVGK